MIYQILIELEIPEFRPLIGRFNGQMAIFGIICPEKDQFDPNWLSRLGLPRHEGPTNSVGKWSFQNTGMDHFSWVSSFGKIFAGHNFDKSCPMFWDKDGLPVWGPAYPTGIYCSRGLSTGHIDRIGLYTDSGKLLASLAITASTGRFSRFPTVPVGFPLLRNNITGSPIRLLQPFKNRKLVLSPDPGTTDKSSIGPLVGLGRILLPITPFRRNLEPFWFLTRKFFGFNDRIGSWREFHAFMSECPTVTIRNPSH
jgi:hypothetical protein